MFNTTSFINFLFHFQVCFFVMSLVIYIYISVCACLCICMCAHICACVHIYIYICVCVCLYNILCLCFIWKCFMCVYIWGHALLFLLFLPVRHDSCHFGGINVIFGAVIFVKNAIVFKVTCFDMYITIKVACFDMYITISVFNDKMIKSSLLVQKSMFQV